VPFGRGLMLVQVFEEALCIGEQCEMILPFATDCAPRRRPSARPATGAIAALANAVRDTICLRLHDLPFTAERINSAIGV